MVEGSVGKSKEKHWIATTDGAVELYLPKSKVLRVDASDGSVSLERVKKGPYRETETVERVPKEATLRLAFPGLSYWITHIPDKASLNQPPGSSFIDVRTQFLGLINHGVARILSGQTDLSLSGQQQARVILSEKLKSLEVFQKVGTRLQQKGEGLHYHFDQPGSTFTVNAGWLSRIYFQLLWQDQI